MIKPIKAEFKEMFEPIDVYEGISEIGDGICWLDDLP